MQETKSQEFIFIEEALNATTGSRKYQKRMLLILMLGSMAISPLSMCNQFFLPYLPSNSELSAPEPDLSNISETPHPAPNDLHPPEHIFASFYSAGMFFSCFIFPLVIDRNGRKAMVKYSCIICAGIYSMIALSEVWYMSWTFGFIAGALDTGIYISSFILCAELIDFKKRNLYLGLYTLAWPVSAVIFTGIYMTGISWKYVISISVWLILLELCLLRYVVESPRFLLTNAVNVEAATKAMNQISLTNGQGEFSYRLRSESEKKKGFWAVREIFGTKLIKIQLGACCVVWFSTVVAYFGILFIMPIEDVIDILGVEAGYGYIVLNLVEILATLAFIALIDRCGRKKTSVIVFLLLSSIFFLISFLRDSQEQETFDEKLNIFILLMIAKGVVSGEFYLIYLHTAEIFPTRMRGTAFGICNIIGRCSNMHYLNFLMMSSFWVLGIVMFVTAGLAVTLEETLDKEFEEIADEKQVSLLNTLMG